MKGCAKACAAWSVPYRNDFATVLQNRGFAQNNGDLAAAIADYDAAVEIREGMRNGLRAAGGDAAWTAPLRVDLARIYATRAMALGPARGAQDRAAAVAIADGLQALNRDGAAREVRRFCAVTFRQWASRNPFAAIAALRAQGSAVFWLALVFFLLALVLLVLLAPILVPLRLLIRGLGWLRQRIGARGRRR